MRSRGGVGFVGMELCWRSGSAWYTDLGIGFFWGVGGGLLMENTEMTWLKLVR